MPFENCKMNLIIFATASRENVLNRLQTSNCWCCKLRFTINYAGWRTARQEQAFSTSSKLVRTSTYRSISFEDVLTMLASNFLLLRDERKGRESVRLRCREKRKREAFDPSGIGLYCIDNNRCLAKIAGLAILPVYTALPSKNMNLPYSIRM